MEGGSGSAVCSGGDSRQEEDCSGDSSAEWSECVGGLQYRHVSEEESQTRACDVSAKIESDGTSVNMIVGACIIGFILGSIVGAGIVYYYLKVKKNGGLNPPHYISAKSQNLYVSLPMLDLNKHKQLANTSNYSDMGTLLSLIHI